MKVVKLQTINKQERQAMQFHKMISISHNSAIPVSHNQHCNLQQKIRCSPEAAIDGLAEAGERHHSSSEANPTRERSDFFLTLGEEEEGSPPPCPGPWPARSPPSSLQYAPADPFMSRGGHERATAWRLVSAAEGIP